MIALCNFGLYVTFFGEGTYDNLRRQEDLYRWRVVGVETGKYGNLVNKSYTMLPIEQFTNLPMTSYYGMLVAKCTSLYGSAIPKNSSCGLHI